MSMKISQIFLVNPQKRKNKRNIKMIFPEIMLAEVAEEVEEAIEAIEEVTEEVPIIFECLLIK